MDKKTIMLTIWSLFMAAFGTEIGRWADAYITEPFVFWFRVAVGLLFVVVMTIGFGSDIFKERRNKEPEQ